MWGRKGKAAFDPSPQSSQHARLGVCCRCDTSKALPAFAQSSAGSVPASCLDSGSTLITLSAVPGCIFIRSECKSVQAILAHIIYVVL